MRRGHYGDQFIENEYTLVGEVFVLNVVSQVILVLSKLTLRTVKAALKAVTPEFKV